MDAIWKFRVWVLCYVVETFRGQVGCMVCGHQMSEAVKMKAYGENGEIRQTADSVLPEPFKAHFRNISKNPKCEISMR